MAELATATQLADQFTGAFNKNDLQTCKRLLSSLKLEMTKLPGLPPVYEQGPTSQQQLLLARQVLEQAVLLSIRLQDEPGFERNFNQLRVYYGEARPLLPPSPQEGLLLSLNLLRLLVQNRIAEFHTELELLPPELQQQPEITQVTELEQWLMEGAYNKVLDARRRAASDYYAHFLDQLSSTVRDEVASCSERAYRSLSLADAAKILMCSSQEEALQYAQQRGWEVADGRVVFKAEMAGGQAGDRATGGVLAAQDLITHCLAYAKELERIV